MKQLERKRRCVLISVLMLNVILGLGFCHQTYSQVNNYSSVAKVKSEHNAMVSLSSSTTLPDTLSQQKRYQANVRLESPVSLRMIHTWVVSINLASGAPLTGAELSISGGMPEHNHGLPTAPTYREVSPGTYEVQGMKFQMLGPWFVDILVTSALGQDTLHFEFILDKIH